MCIRDRPQLTLIYHRHNLTEELLAEFFSISQPTVSRTITLVEKALLEILEPLIKPLEQALDVPGSLVVDGTLIPAWNWRWLSKINFSGKHKRAGFNHQVICTLEGKLLAMKHPLPGARHDAFVFKEHGLEQYLGETTLADKGYIGLGLLTPFKRKPGVRMRAAVRENNRRVNRLRSVVELSLIHI